MNEQLKDVIVRAIKTFVFSFAAVLLVTPDPTSKAAVAAAVATGIGAVFNTGNKVVQAHS